MSAWLAGTSSFSKKSAVSQGNNVYVQSCRKPWNIQYAWDCQRLFMDAAISFSL